MSQVTSVNAANPTGTCVSASPFTADGTCTVLAGETVNFVVVGGNGGNGGDYVVNVGSVGYDDELSGSGVPNGVGGIGGLGAKVSGAYSNTTGATVTFTLVVGAHGVNGNDYTIATGGEIEVMNGGQGGPGGDGGDSKIVINGVDLVVAGGGKGGLGGTVSTNGNAGDPGEALPNPLPSGWTSELSSGTPGITFTGTGVAPATTTTVAPTTTVAEKEETTTALPQTGSQSGQFMLVALVALGLGGLITVSRRRINQN